MATETEKELAAKKKEFEELKKDSEAGFDDYVKLFSGMTEDEILSFDDNGELSALMEKLYADPKYKNYQRRQEIAKNIEGGIDVLNTLSNMSVARRQIDVAQQEEAKLRDPQAPPTTPKSTELASATEQAQRDLTAPITDIDPILQQNMQNLRGNLGAARTASTGQAGIYGSLAQSAFNNLRQSNNNLIPAIQAIRRQQQEEYNKLISAGISEDDMRFRQAMDKYQVAENRYLKEAQAVGNLRATGEQNLLGQRQLLYDQMGQSVNPLINQQLFQRDKKAPLNQYNYQLPNIQSRVNLQGQNLNYLDRFKPEQGFTALGNLGKKYQDNMDKVNFDLQNSYTGNYQVPNY